MKKNHKNDKRRITSLERARRFVETHNMTGFNRATDGIVKMLEAHVKAAHRRHARKNICTPRKSIFNG